MESMPRERISEVLFGQESVSARENEQQVIG